MENKQNIDQLFKDGLLEPDIPFDEQNWEKMSIKLDTQARKRVVPVWLLWSSAVAAILLVFLFWMFFKSDVSEQTQPKNQVAKQQQSGSGINTPNQSAKGNVKETKSESDKKDIKPSKNSLEPSATYAGHPESASSTISERLAIVGNVPSITDIQAAGSGFAVSFDATINTRMPRSAKPSSGYAAVVKGVKKKMKSVSGQKPGLVLSAMLAPDISYAKSSLASKVSSNAGLLATYAFSPKLSVTSGAIYSNKFYNSNVQGVNAYNASGASYQVNASCNVLDIPLNVNYKVLEKRTYSVSLSTGLSSYLMLKEKYNYIYPQPGSAANIVSYQVSNQNKHILGVANVGISVERKITSKLSIGVQPFMKLPLTGIGAGDASLKSSGLSFSLNMNLFPAKKPGKFAGLRH